MFHNDLYAYLIGTSAVNDLFAGGIHHMSVPQDVDVWPAMSFQLVASSEFAADMDGPNDPTIDQMNYQFSITDNDSAGVIAAADSFHAIFRNFRGTMGASTVQLITVGNVTHLEERQGDKLRRRVVLDYSIFINA